MCSHNLDDGPPLVAAVRRAAAVHKVSWAAMLPDQVTIDKTAEAAEERDFVAMAAEKRRLREHIRATYGVSIRELANLAMV